MMISNYHFDPLLILIKSKRFYGLYGVVLSLASFRIAVPKVSEDFRASTPYILVMRLGQGFPSFCGRFSNRVRGEEPCAGDA